jgi:hypothetical protein
MMFSNFVYAMKEKNDDDTLYALEERNLRLRRIYVGVVCIYIENVEST